MFSRTFDAPRELMFDVWTDVNHLSRWFGPKGAEIVSATNDLRPGGIFHYGMRIPDGTVIWGRWIYREITRPERLVFLSSFSDDAKGVTRHPFAPQWPLEMLSTVLFTESDGKTTVTVYWSPIHATDVERTTFAEGKPSMTQGWTGTFENLEAYVKELA
ncbi:MAG TPA: SRPBCC domain-containing protein [Thermoanaerobaculia bacterium]|nr:SRPBCC domain-containing protein [Thermoanaerobaculia bacterium]